MPDIMLDIETFGTVPGAPIVQIAAVTFERKRTMSPIHTWSRNVSLDSCLRMGLKEINAETMQFWAQQDPVLFFQMCSGDDMLYEVLRDMNDFAEEVGGGLWWANGQDFDFGIMDHAFEVAQTDAPWAYNEKRDLRTLIDISGLDKRCWPKPEGQHDAKVDCFHQIEVAQECFRLIAGEAPTRVHDS